jgi:molybdopterin molybdotransferase
VSSFDTFQLAVRPLLLRLQGADPAPAFPPTLMARADFDWPRPDRRREFLRVRRNAEGGLELFANQSSAVLTSAVWGDGVADIAPGQTVQRGDGVRYLSFADLLAS